MTISQPEWDTQVAPLLHRVEDCSRRITQQAQDVQMAVTMLQVRPNWPTKAEDQLSLAISVLERLENQIGVAKMHLMETVERYSAIDTEKPAGPPYGYGQGGYGQT